MCGLLSVIFFIIGVFGKTFETTMACLIISALFAIADALYSIKDKNEDEK